MLQKVASFFECEPCKYKTRNKNNFQKHLLTTKHAKYNAIQPFCNIVATCNMYTCKCGKQYPYRASLFNHSKKCTYIDEPNSDSCNGLVATNDASKTEIMVQTNDQIDYKEMFFKMVEENKEVKELLTKQQEQICELIPKIGNITMVNTVNNVNNVNTVNNVNQKLNINIFLNEKCKDAVNINDFVKNIEISLQHIDFTKNKGLAEGLTNAIIENMSKLSLYERPMHCTDIKRETLYIKDNDVWEKDNDKTKIKKAIKDVSNKQFRTIKKWTDENPDFQEVETKQDYFARILSVLGKDPSTVNDKVIKKICNNAHLKNLIKETEP